MSEWKELDIGNLPSDIMVGYYDIQFDTGTGVYLGTSNLEKRHLIIENMTHGRKYRYRPKQKPAPTHEEIMTKWWNVTGRMWFRVSAYIDGVYTFVGRDISIAADKDDFATIESADIPPES